MHHPASIPLVMIEEHHEAFCVWHNAIWRRWIAPSGNPLLHVDEHSDLRLPSLRRPLRWFDDPSDAARFAYEELGIGTFIWPAVVQGIFDRMIWLRPDARRAEPVRVMRAWLNARGEIEVASHHHASEGAAPPAGARSLELACPTAGEVVPLDQPFVLDVDLDFFASHRRAMGCFELEVAYATYRDFTQNPYHFLRLSCWDRATASQRDGRYFLRFGSEREEDSTPVTHTIVEQRCRRLGDFLASQPQRPSLITICRSVHSGYTPRDWSEHLERMTRDLLARLYVLSPCETAELIPAGSGRLHELPITRADAGTAELNGRADS